MSDDNPYAPPEAQIAPDAGSEDVELAGRGTRLGGSIIDSLSVSIIILPIAYATGYFDSVMEQTVSGGQIAGMAVLGFIAFLAVHGYLLATRGQTVGKYLLGMQIVSHETNEILPLWRVFVLRYLVMGGIGQIPVAGPLLNMVNILLIFRQDRRCGHDLIAGTKVIDIRNRAAAA